MDTREALQAAFDQVEAAPAVETAEPVAAEAAPATETTEVAADRARDELGRFAAKPAEPAAKPIEVKPVEELDPPPKSWKKDYHAHWGKMDPEVRKYINQREEEFHRGVGTYKQNADVGQQFMEAARPYEAIMRSLNVTPVQAFQALANADYTLRTADPATKSRLFAQLAQQYGVSLDNIQNPPEVDQNTQALHQTIHELRAHVQRLEGSFNGYQQTTIQSEIDKFASKPHFEELKPTMAQLLNSGMAADLGEAYDKALRLTPDLFDQVQAQQKQEAERQRLQEAAQAAAKAKAAAVQVTGGPSTASAESPKGIRGALEAAFEQSIR